MWPAVGAEARAASWRSVAILFCEMSLELPVSRPNKETGWEDRILHFFSMSRYRVLMIVVNDSQGDRKLQKAPASEIDPAKPKSEERITGECQGSETWRAKYLSLGSFSVFSNVQT